MDSLKVRVARSHKRTDGSVDRRGESKQSTLALTANKAFADETDLELSHESFPQ